MSRDADEIRDSFLANTQTEFQAIQKRIVTTRRSPMHALGTALALELEGAEAEAEAARLEAFPGSASDDGVLLHAEFDGLTRVPASTATLRVAVEGTPSATLAIPEGAELTDPEGQVFLATAGSVAFDGAGHGFATITARDPGAGGNLALGTELRWQPAPTGFSPTATVALAPGDTTHILVTGAAEESIEELRRRVERWRREPAQGGNRAQWVVWLEEVVGAAHAFVWPRTWRRNDSDWRFDRPGVLAAQILGPAPPDDSYVQNPDGTLGLGLRHDFTRIPSPTLLATAKAYIEGTVDAAGRPVPTALQEQLRPVGMGERNYTITAPPPVTVNFTVRLTTDPAIAPWPWGFGPGEALHREIVSATSTTLTLNSVLGIRPTSRLAVKLGTGAIAGGWWVGTVASVAGNVVTLTQAMPSTPTAGTQKVRPDCGLWSEVRARILRGMHTMGPGDAVDSIPSQRFPRPVDEGMDRLFLSTIFTWLDGISGLVGVQLDAPTGTSTPSVGRLLVAGEVAVLAG